MKKKKGFTLVELLVVIAILAILAAVSVIGYLGFTEKANLSNDQTTIKMINDNLLASSIEKRPETAGEAITQLENLGFTKEKLVAYSNDHHYVYDLKNNSFILLDENDDIIYPENANKNKDDLWGLILGNNDDNVNLNNYVAFSAITNEDQFKALTSGVSSLNIDLNNKYFYLPTYQETNVEITLNHGYYVPGDQNNSSINTDKVEEKSEVIDCSNGINLEELEYKNVIFDFSTNGSGGGTISILDGEMTSFDNCVFLCKKGAPGKSGVTISTSANPKEYVPNLNTALKVDNCMILNALWFQMTILNVDIANSNFVNCIGGVNLQRPTISANIYNNTFDIKSADVDGRLINTPLMLSPENLKDSNGNYLCDSYSDGYHVNFSNNEINETYSLLRVHFISYEKRDDYKTIIPSQLTIVNNKIGLLKSEIVEGFHKNGANGPEYVQPSSEVQALFDEIKNIIK